MINNTFKNKQTVRKTRKSAIIFAFTLLVLAVFICACIRQNNKTAEACDLKKGHTCSYYEIRNFSIRGE